MWVIYRTCGLFIEHVDLPCSIQIIFVVFCREENDGIMLVRFSDQTEKSSFDRVKQKVTKSTLDLFCDKLEANADQKERM